LFEIQPRQGREAKGLSDCRQSARPSRQGGSGLVGAPQGRDRDFLSPGVCAGANPDEYLNNDLKQTIKNKPRAKTRDELVAATASILKSIQKLHRNRVKDGPALRISFWRVRHSAE
jgi:hypothetical protein